MNLQELKKEILRDGFLKEDEVEKLRDAMFDEEGMTLPKGNLMFDLKDEISPEKRIESFNQLFVDAISSLLLDDEISPGEIDDNEARWLRAHIQKNGRVDELDKRLLENLKVKSINYPQILNYKSKRAKLVERGLYSSRYLAIFAVVGSLLAAIALFIKSTMYVGKGLYEFIIQFNVLEENAEHKSPLQVLMPYFVESVDTYLFAMVLIIFGIGIYELFINKIDPTEQNLDSRPSWLQINSIDSLKSSLGNVILMVLIVSVFEHSLNTTFATPYDLLQLAVGVVLVALALFLTHLSHKKSDDNGHS